VSGAYGWVLNASGSAAIKRPRVSLEYLQTTRTSGFGQLKRNSRKTGFSANSAPGWGEPGELVAMFGGRSQLVMMHLVRSGKLRLEDVKGQLRSSSAANDGVVIALSGEPL
jgi:hypothetical protein